MNSCAWPTEACKHYFESQAGNAPRGCGGGGQCMGEQGKIRAIS